MASVSLTLLRFDVVVMPLESSLALVSCLLAIGVRQTAKLTLHAFFEQFLLTGQVVIRDAAKLLARSTRVFAD